MEPSLAVSMLAHDLRAPLASLAAASELLLRDGDRIDPQEMREMLRVIRSGTVWLQGLVENLLCAASIRAGDFRIHAEPQNLLDLVLTVQPIVTPLLRQKGQELKVAAAPDLPAVSADRRWIGQVLVNLLANASKYSGATTPIAVRLTQRNDAVRVAVADRGPGLPPGGQARLFEPFCRGEGAATADPKGIGLGLAIVHAVVEAHGGRVGAENRPNGGACIWFELARI
ncbi:MAG TPA: ATP-binding protein [Chloroflexota bacterium]|jgi:two-component system sensor histidine kinase KdpD